MNPPKISSAPLLGFIALVGGLMPAPAVAQAGPSTTAAIVAGDTLATSAGAAAITAACAHCVSPTGHGQSPEPLRVFEDPGRGERWLLIPDPLNPSGPGRMVRSASFAEESGPRRPVKYVAGPIIRAGDQLTIEEHTDTADVELHAVALAPARAGKIFAARIMPGGTVLRVIASAPGRALLPPAGEMKP